jgi:hypothetical protein
MAQDAHQDERDWWLAFGLSFVSGDSDAVSFILALTFTGHVSGNLVMVAISLVTLHFLSAFRQFAAVLFAGRLSQRVDGGHLEILDCVARSGDCYGVRGPADGCCDRGLSDALFRGHGSLADLLCARARNAERGLSKSR